MTTRCRLCGNPLETPAYRSQTHSLTSLCTVVPGPTELFHCRKCGHLQTTPLADARAYYAQSYNILNQTPEEDQILRVDDGTVTYRLAHQADTFLRKVALHPGMRILDFGCAKAETLRRIAASAPGTIPLVFDVSDAYAKHWADFVSPEHRATFELPPQWRSRIDVVTSFFALEHADDAYAFFRDIASMLRPGGVLYLLVPNVRVNIADFVVRDHIHHFTASTLRFVTERAGFDVIEIDEETHDGALILSARKRSLPHPHVAPSGLEEANALAEQLTGYWTTLQREIRAFERRAGAAPSAIYGAGFWGSYIATCLTSLHPVRCFIDRNPHLCGSERFGKPVRSVHDVDRDARELYVGLRPAIARDAIADVAEIAARFSHPFFLPEVHHAA